MEDNLQIFQGEFNKFGNLWKRGIAAIADGFILGIPVGIIFIIFFASIGAFKAEKFTTPPDYQIIYLILAVLLQYLVPLAYFTYFIGKSGQTPGKKAIGVKVFKVDGSEVNYKIAFCRYLIFFLYMIPKLGGVLFLISIILVLLDKKKQALHDKICKTVVLYKG